MTDKEQIIINGVDVSGCEYLTNELEEDGEYYWFCNIAPAGGPDECEYKPECFYKKILKQLARKTQECEELKKYISEKEGIGDDCDYCKHNDKYNCYQNIFLDNLKEINRYKQALEPFEDEYFKGLDTKQIAELAKKSIRLTTENRKLENKLSDIAGICEQILDGEDYVRRIAKTILDIINKAKDGNNDR